MEDVQEEENGMAEEILGSSLTMKKMAAAKQYIENHYRGQIKIIQKRKERRWILERKLASSRVPKEKQINMIKDLERKETEFMRLKRNKIVHLCREKKSANIYAMKKLNKSEMVMREQRMTWASPVLGQGLLDPYASDLEQKRLMLQMFQKEHLVKIQSDQNMQRTMMMLEGSLFIFPEEFVSLQQQIVGPIS